MEWEIDIDWDRNVNRDWIFERVWEIVKEDIDVLNNVDILDDSWEMVIYSVSDLKKLDDCNNDWDTEK